MHSSAGLERRRARYVQLPHPEVLCRVARPSDAGDRGRGSWPLQSNPWALVFLVPDISGAPHSCARVPLGRSGVGQPTSLEGGVGPRRLKCSASCRLPVPSPRDFYSAVCANRGRRYRRSGEPDQRISGLRVRRMSNDHRSLHRHSTFSKKSRRPTVRLSRQWQ